MPDFSCYITFINNTKWPLYHQSDSISDGHFATSPPDVIQPGSTGNWQLQDNPGAVGSEGYTTYQVRLPGSTINISTHYSCPVWGSNIYTCSSSNPLIINTANSSSGTSGHPLRATSTITSSIALPAGLHGYVPEGISSALEADPNDEGAWEKAQDHLTQMKNAERWTVG